MTMREKLIDIAISTACVGDYDIVDNWDEVLDALLDALAKPPREMVEAAGEAHQAWHDSDEWDAAEHLYRPIFTAMIDHLRAR